MVLQPSISDIVGGWHTSYNRFIRHRNKLRKGQERKGLGVGQILINLVSTIVLRRRHANPDTIPAFRGDLAGKGVAEVVVGVAGCEGVEAVVGRANRTQVALVGWYGVVWGEGRCYVDVVGDVVLWFWWSGVRSGSRTMVFGWFVLWF